MAGNPSSSSAHLVTRTGGWRRDFQPLRFEPRTVRTRNARRRQQLRLLRRCALRSDRERPGAVAAPVGAMSVVAAHAASSFRDPSRVGLGELAALAHFVKMAQLGAGILARGLLGWSAW